jgi:H+-transporting ATPase
VRGAHVDSSEQKAVLGVVRALTVLNFVIVTFMVAYAQWIGMTVVQIVPLVLTALLSAVPVALPATFTLAATVGARLLAQKGVLLTRLTALHEAAMIDVLCVDKTGTLTENALALSSVKPLREGWAEADVLRFAAAASSDDGQDPIDRAIRLAVAGPAAGLRVTHFAPFDPATKMADTTVISPDGIMLRVVKGSPIAVANVVAIMNPDAAAAEAAFMDAGYRTIALAAGPPEAMDMVGLIAFSDRPRVDSAPLLAELKTLGVRTIMVTGDTAATAATVARAIGLSGSACPQGAMPESVQPEDFSIYAGVFPEDKFRLVKAFQRSGHVVGMCGDGANDAPALRQAQMGIAVSTATDVAKSATGLVLTEPGLGGIVTSIREGRSAFQRVLTYTLSILVNKCVTLIVLSTGLIITRHAVLTPLLQGIWMVAGDFVTMARAADHAPPTPYPNVWRVRELTLAGIPLALCKLGYCVGIITIAWYALHLTPLQTQTLTFLTLILAGQATTYVLRERDHFWRSYPARIMLLASAADVALVTMLAAAGWLMAALPGAIIAGLFGTTVLLAFALDAIKVAVLRRLPIDRAA